MGLTPLFSQIAVRALAALDLDPGTGHMDTTTASVYGKYNTDPLVGRVTKYPQ